jgi:hypothetical protein
MSPVGAREVAKWLRNHAAQLASKTRKAYDRRFTARYWYIDK